jgi:serine/threonine protein phosphatase PrpC
VRSALRQFVHQGSVLAEGLAIDTRSVPESEARRRILARMGNIRIVLRHEHILLALLHAPLRVNCAACEGAPLVRFGTVLSSAPLADDEQKQVETLQRGEAILWNDAQQVSVLAVSALAEEDASTWLDLSAFTWLADPVPLGEREADPTVAVVPVHTNLRTSLTIGELPSESKALIHALSDDKTTAAGVSTIAAASFGSKLRQLVASSLRAFGGRLARARSRSGDALVPTRGEGLPGWLSRIGAALESWFSRALAVTQLTRLLGNKHGEYLVRMLNMFDEKDLDEALRHAIPLSHKVADALKHPGLPLRVGSRRQDFSIVPARGAAGSSLALDGDLFDHLRQTYRRAFEALVRRGDIEKAAFVLSELLESNEEAVSFLETHGHYRLAAEIAEARALPIGLVIRQWFLAGDRARAIRLARKYGAFADAVVRLAQSHPDEALALRLIWADTLASQGAYAAAVDAVWPVQAARHLATHWIDTAIEIGGPSGATMLARKAAVAPQHFADVRDHALALLRDNRALVLPLARELTCLSPTPETKVLMRFAARTLLRVPMGPEIRRLLNLLLEQSGDAALKESVRASCELLDPAKRKERDKLPIRLSAVAFAQMGQNQTVNQARAMASILEAPHLDVERALTLGPDTSLTPMLAVFDGYNDTGSSLVPSQLAEQTISSIVLRDVVPGARIASMAQVLVSAMREANRRLCQTERVDVEWGGAFATATIASVCDKTLVVAHVGRARAYLLRDGTLTQLTRDHSLVADVMEVQKAKGEPLSPHQIAEFPHHDVVTRSLGTAPDVDVDLYAVPLQQGDKVLLCNVGVWESIPDSALTTRLADRASVTVLADNVLSRARKTNERGANVAAVVAELAGLGLPTHVGAVHVRTLEPQEELHKKSAPVHIVRSAQDRGATNVFDAVALPDGRMLLALGELGVILVSHAGKVLQRFAQPAEHMVLSDHGDRLLLIAKRGEVMRLARLNLVTKKVRPWCDVQIDQWANDFDGSLWFVSRGGSAYAIDATLDTWESVWSVEESNATVKALARDPMNLKLWFQAGVAQGEFWDIELPSFRLRSRQETSEEEGSVFCGPSAVVSGTRAAVWWATHSDASGVTSLVPRMLRGKAIRDLFVDGLVLGESFENIRPCISERWTVVAYASGTNDDAQIEIRVYAHDQASAILFMELPSTGTPGLAPSPYAAARTVGIRIQGDTLIVCDAVGRVLVIELPSGEVRWEYRA